MQSPVSTPLPRLDPDLRRVFVLIDTPAGSRNKYKFEPTLAAFSISRILPDGLAFPCDFGSIPGTCAEDGDALDALVVGAPPTFPGCVVRAVLLGIIYARQTESGRSIRNDRLVACADTKVNRPKYRTLQELGEERLRAIELFFETYNRAEGRSFRIIGRGNARAARTTLKRALDAHRGHSR